MGLVNITRQYADDQILYQADLDAIIDDIEEALNEVKLDSENIAVGGIIADNLATSSVTAIKIATGAVNLEKLAAEVTAKLVPTGTVVAYAGTTAPTGWLMCDGQAVGRTAFAALFAVIGETHGQGDNVLTFNVPDYRGRFLRGRDAGTARDPDAASRTAMNTGGNTGDAVGSVQDNAFGSHNHGGGNHNHTFHVYNGSSVGTVSYPPGANIAVGGADSNTSSSGVIINTEGGNETRPVNVSVNFIIKT